MVGPVYHIQCEDCDASYIEETERSLETSFQEHCRRSSVTSEVSQHMSIDRLEHNASLESVIILSVENKKFERGVIQGGNSHLSSPAVA